MDNHNISMYLDHQYHDYVIISTDDQQVNFTSTNFLRENEHKKLNTSGSVCDHLKAFIHHIGHPHQLGISQ